MRSIITWSPDGRKLATLIGDLAARVWDAGTGRELFTLRGGLAPPNDTIYAIAWSPYGGKLATARLNETGKVWDANTGRELLSLTRPTGSGGGNGSPLNYQSTVVSVAWSLDGSKLATASADETAKVWDAKTGRELLTLRARSLAWSPRDTKLAVVTGDHTVQVYAIDPTLLLRLARSRITRELRPDECRRYLNADHCPTLPLVP